jgi:hypothetical protein
MMAAHHCAALGLKKAPAKLIESGADMRRPNVFGDVPEGLQYHPSLDFLVSCVSFDDSEAS